jgi:hypothetical protein
MDIIEMRQKKAALEHTLGELLNIFEEETLLKVDNIHFERGYECTERGSFIFNVNLGIRL